MRPFSTTESSTFRNMIQECESRYSFPAGSTFSDKIIPRMYESVSTRVKYELKGAESVAWTTDSWTSRVTQLYVTITAHFINSYMQLCSRVQQTRELCKSHTVAHMGGVLLEAQQEWSCKVLTKKQNIFQLPANKLIIDVS